MSNSVKEIKVSDIETNENSRVAFKTANVTELMISMKQHGQLQAIGVRPLGYGGYETIWGNSRLLAAIKLGWTTIKCEVRTADDIERDILNLVENLNRSNTTPTEDGRTFHSLMDRGLTHAEIAARCSIGLDRVRTAIEVYENVPAEFRAYVKYATPGHTPKNKGIIPAGAAKSVMGIRRKYKLNKAETKAVLKAVKDDGLNSKQVDYVAPLLKKGYELSEALDKASKLERVSLTVYIDAGDVLRAEKRTGKTIQEVLFDLIEKDRSLRVLRTVSDSGKFRAKGKESNHYKTRAARALDQAQV